MRKYITYTIVHPNGDVDRLRVPNCWDALDVARKLRDCEVFCHVPRGHSMLTENRGSVKGPAVVHSNGENLNWVTEAPRTDGEAVRVLRSAGLLG